MGASELNGGLDGYAHGDLGREAIDGKVMHACIVHIFFNAHKYAVMLDFKRVNLDDMEK